VQDVNHRHRAVPGAILARLPGHLILEVLVNLADEALDIHAVVLVEVAGGGPGGADVPVVPRGHRGGIHFGVGVGRFLRELVHEAAEALAVLVGPDTVLLGQVEDRGQVDHAARVADVLHPRDKLLEPIECRACDPRLLGVAAPMVVQASAAGAGAYGTEVGLGESVDAAVRGIGCERPRDRRTLDPDGVRQGDRVAPGQERQELLDGPAHARQVAPAQHDPAGAGAVRVMDRAHHVPTITGVLGIGADVVLAIQRIHRRVVAELAEQDEVLTLNPELRRGGLGGHYGKLGVGGPPHAVLDLAGEVLVGLMPRGDDDRSRLAALDQRHCQVELLHLEVVLREGRSYHHDHSDESTRADPHGRFSSLSTTHREVRGPGSRSRRSGSASPAAPRHSHASSRMLRTLMTVR